MLRAFLCLKLYLPNKSEAMPILDLYEHGEKRKNLAHFATLASLAAVDGEVNEKEKTIWTSLPLS